MGQVTNDMSMQVGILVSLITYLNILTEDQN